MVGYLKILKSTLAVCWILVSGVGVANAGETEFERNLTEALEAIRVEDRTVGFSVGVIRGGELVYARGFGETLIDSDRSITPRSVFHWASVSKPFVATAIMQLVERGMLDLDARLVNVLPGYVVTDPRHREITIEHILLHTSGLPDVEDYEWDKPQMEEIALKKWAYTDSPRELLFDPGTKRAYSNIGFEVLGAIIEQVSGVSFEKYMADNIFTPLGMKDSTFFYPDVPEALRTYGHTGDASSKQATPHYPYNRRHGPSSTLNTNIEDMSRFVFALLNGGDLDGALLLKPQTLTDMWRPRWTIHKEASHFATAGWIHEIRDGQRMLRHFGGDVGFRSVLAIMPDDKAAIFLVSNDDRANTRALALAVLAAMAEN